MHLTNYSINKMSVEYVRPLPDQILIHNEATKRTLASLRKTFEAKGLDYETVWTNIKDACGRTMEIYAPMIQHQVKTLAGSKLIEGKPF